MTYLLLDRCCQLLERRLMRVLVAGITGIIPSAFVFLPYVPSSSRLCIVFFFFVFFGFFLSLSLSRSLCFLSFLFLIFPNDLLLGFFLMASS
jgi:hypothetical protein